MLAKRFVSNENRVGIKIPTINWRSDLKSPLVSPRPLRALKFDFMRDSDTNCPATQTAVFVNIRIRYT